EVARVSDFLPRLRLGPSGKKIIRIDLLYTEAVPGEGAYGIYLEESQGTDVIDGATVKRSAFGANTISLLKIKDGRDEVFRPDEFTIAEESEKQEMYVLEVMLILNANICPQAGMAEEDACKAHCRRK